jgi:hypothetical protein
VSGTGGLGTALAIVRGYESRDDAALGASPVDAGQLAQDYLAAVSWSNHTFDVIGGRN